MTPASKLDIAIDYWNDLHGFDGAPSSAYHSLRRTMRQLVPETDAFAAVEIAAAEGDGDEKAILVLQGDTLYIGKAVIEGSELSIEVRKEPLDPTRVSVRMVERSGEKGPVRTWTFERDGNAFLSMRTTKVPRAFHDDTPETESFALALCRAVGWDVPADDG